MKDKGSVCANASFTLSATGTGTWSGGAGSFNNPNLANVSYTPAPSEAGTTVILTWTVQGACVSNLIRCGSMSLFCLLSMPVLIFRHVLVRLIWLTMPPALVCGPVEVRQLCQPLPMPWQLIPRLLHRRAQPLTLPTVTNHMWCYQRCSKCHLSCQSGTVSIWPQCVVHQWQSTSTYPQYFWQMEPILIHPLEVWNLVYQFSKRGYYTGYQYTGCIQNYKYNTCFKYLGLLWLLPVFWWTLPEASSKIHRTICHSGDSQPQHLWFGKNASNGTPSAGVPDYVFPAVSGQQALSFTLFLKPQASPNGWVLLPTL